jgi:hypothetical protein
MFEPQKARCDGMHVERHKVAKHMMVGGGGEECSIHEPKTWHVLKGQIWVRLLECGILRWVA